MTRSGIRHSEAGFTLIELLVAITLVSLLTVLLFGGLRFGTRAASAVALRTDRSAETAAVYDFMQSAMADTRTLSDSSDPSQALTDFDGEPDALTFVTVPPAYLALGGFHRLHVAKEGTDANGRLVVSWQQIVRGSLPPPVAKLQPSIILDKVRSVAFAYFGIGDPNRPPDWQDHWVERSSLPQLIRLRVTWADGSRAPDLIVAPRLAGAPLP